MRTPDFSLILATVGRTDQLARLFDSLAAQSFVNYEVIVVDQNDDDRLLPHLERARYLGIALRHLKHHPANLAAARNAGIAAARGKWIGFPDDDCWYAPRLLERVAARFSRSDEPTGIVVRWVEQDEQPAAAGLLSWERSRAFRDIAVSSITLFCRRSLFARIGGFDNRLGVGQWFGAGEETDFMLRALRAGVRIVYEPHGEVHHAAGTAPAVADAAARADARRRARGAGALYAKHRLPVWVVLRGFAAPLLRPLLKGAFGTELSLGYATLRGRVDGYLAWRRSGDAAHESATAIRQVEKTRQDTSVAP